jgi:hypothetical protein
MTEISVNISLIPEKPLQKLIETISSGIGVLYNPRKIRNEAEAEAYRLITLAQAEATGLLIKDDTQNELARRASQRFVHQEIVRQTNIESIADRSAGYLTDHVSETPVDEEWKAKFFNKAQDISNHELQDIWAKILAKEVTSPGNISIRALEILSTITKREAIIFETFISNSLSGCIPTIGREFSDPAANLTFENLLLMQEIGLVGATHVEFSVLNLGYNNSSNLLFHNFVVPVVAIAELKSDGYSITRVGEELTKGMDIPKPEAFATHVCKFLMLRGDITEIGYDYLV